MVELERKKSRELIKLILLLLLLFLLFFYNFFYSFTFIGQHDICRVCRSEGTDEQPLFYPCLCSGSIKYIHQDCLVEWLKHSRKRYCELCKHPFTFSPVYAEQMPKKIPFTVILYGLVKKSISGGRVLFSWSFATVLWFLAVPVITAHIFRYYFGWSLKGILKAALPFDDINDPVLETSLVALLDVIQGFLMMCFTFFLIVGMLLLREFISLMIRTEPVTPEREPARQSTTESTSTNANDTDASSSVQESNHVNHLRSPLSPTRTSAVTSPLSPIRRHSALSPNRTASSSAANPTTNSNFWLDNVHPKEYRNYIRRRDLHAEQIEAEQNRSDNSYIFAQNVQDESDPLLNPEDHISNVSGTSTLRSRMTNFTNETSNTSTLSNMSFRCRICFSNTCISREHVIQATQIRNNLSAQRHQSLLERTTRDINEPEPGNAAPTDPIAEPAIETPTTTTADQRGFGLNFDTVESVSLADFFGFTSEGTSILELLQNSAIVIGCNTLAMHMFLFVPYITGRSFSNGTFPNFSVKIIKALLMLLVKSEDIEIVSDFVRFKVVGSDFVASLMFNKYVNLISFDSDSISSLVFNICLGYAVLCSALSVYIRLTRSFTDSFHRVFVPIIGFIGQFIKLLSLLFIEMVLFPLACGFMVDYACLALFPGMTFYDRLQGVKTLPLTSLSVHWALGAFFMISFASYVTFLRSFLRPGLLFFLRNPVDPDNHPVKDMVERGFLDQMLRLGYSLLFYGFLIASSVGLTAKILTIPLISRLILPHNFNLKIQFLQIPIDLILVILLHKLWKFVYPLRLLKTVYISSSKRLFRTLNLSSYFIGGGRYLNEESFPQGGRWVAVPDFDRIYSRKRLKEIRSRIVTPVDVAKLKILTDKQGNPVLPSSSDSTRSASAADWTIVFRPNYFKLKCLTVLVSAIISLQSFLLTAALAPVFCGRWIVKNLTDQPVNELVSWLIGAIAVLLAFKAIELMFFGSRSSRRRQLREADSESTDEESSVFDKLALLVSSVFKSTLVGFFVFFLWPLQAGLLLTLIINPLLYSETSETASIEIVFLGACWSLGIPVLKLLYTLRAHLPLPSWTTSYRVTSLESLSAREFLRKVAFPVTLLLTAILTLPPLSCLILFPSDRNLQNSSHLLAIAAYILLKLTKLVVNVSKQTVTGIRDEAYLVGRRLHNLENRNN